MNKFIFKLGAFFRNPSLTEKFHELKSSEFCSRQELDDLQNKKFNELLKFCHNHSDFYREKLKESGYDYRNDYDLDFIENLPIISKEDLLTSNQSIHTTGSFKFNKLFFSETSGSSGEALTFNKDEEWDSYNRASIFRGLSWFEIEPWDKSGYFWGFNISFLQSIKVKILDVLVNRFRVFTYEDTEIKQFLKLCKNAKYIEGYSSMIYEVAKKANEMNIKVDNLKLIKGTSEKIYDHYHKETYEAFGLKIVSEYGSAESGIIAFECPFGNMHVNEETCVLEIIEGRAIVTNLVARSFPTIRYDLGDYVSFSDEPCECGRAHKVISEVTGRVGKNIIDLSGKSYPSLTLYYVFKNMAVNHDCNISYRCIQEKQGDIIVLYETMISSKEERKLLLEFDKYFSNMNIELKYVSSIRQKGKKLKDFESLL